MFSFRNSTRSVQAIVGLGLLAASLYGCSSSPHVVARVGDHNITVAQFKTMAEQLASRYMAPPDSARVLLLDDMVNRELLLVSARTNPATPDSYVTKRRTQIEEEALSGALLEQMTPKDLGVSAAEIKQLYLWRQNATHCQIAFISDLAGARKARQAIDAGEDFGAVAARYDVTGMLPPRGDLGFIEAGALVNPLDRVVRDSPVGAVVGPVEAPGQGWFIVKIIGREPRETGPLDQQEAQLRSLLEQRKQKTALLQNYADLRSEYHITPVQEGLQLMYQRLNAARQLQDFGADPSATQLSPQDRAAVVGRWDRGPAYRGTLTLGEAMDVLNSGHGARLIPARFDSYDEWVRLTVLQRVAIVEARRRHLDQEPKTAERIRQAVDNFVLQAVYQTQVLDRADPNDAEVEETYERNAVALAQLKSVNVQYVTLPDSALAVRVAEKSMDSGSLAQGAPVAAPGVAVREEVVKFPTSNPVWQMLQPALTQQSLGGLLGPVHLPDGWRIVQIIARDAPVPALANLPREQQDALRQQARELASDRRLRVFTDSLRKAIPVTIDRDELKHVAWPMAIQMIPGMPGS